MSLSVITSGHESHMPRLRCCRRRGRRLLRGRGRDPDAGGLHGGTDPAGGPGQEGTVQALQRRAPRGAEQVRLAISSHFRRYHQIGLALPDTILQSFYMKITEQ